MWESTGYLWIFPQESASNAEIWRFISVVSFNKSLNKQTSWRWFESTQCSCDVIAMVMWSSTEGVWHVSKSNTPLFPYAFQVWWVLTHIHQRIIDADLLSFDQLEKISVKLEHNKYLLGKCFPKCRLWIVGHFVQDLICLAWLPQTTNWNRQISTILLSRQHVAGSQPADYFVINKWFVYSQW